MGQSRGFTVVELMISLVVIAVLAAIALPAYSALVSKGRARSAGTDLLALAADLENGFQRTRTYPTLRTGSTEATAAATPDWRPSQGEFFVYTMVSDPRSPDTYLLTATGQGAMAGCVLSLAHNDHRTVSSACDVGAW